MVWSRRCAGTRGIRAIRSLMLVALLWSARASDLTRAGQNPQQPFDDTNATLSGGQVVRHSVALTAGQSGSLVVIHRGVDLFVRLLDAEGKVDVEVGSDGRDGEVRLRVHATRTGPHAFEVAAAYPRGSAGQYSVRFDEVRQATNADRHLAAALRHGSRARRLRSVDAYAEALVNARQALRLQEEVRGAQAPEVARSLLLVAQLNDRTANYKQANTLYVRARQIAGASASDHELLSAAILDAHAANHIARGAFGEADALVRKALAIRERILGPDHFLVAASLATLADLHYESSNVQEAVAAANGAFEIASRWYGPGDAKLGDFTDRRARAQILVGNYARAEQLYGEFLAARDGSQDRAETATAISGLARVALVTNDNVKAQQLYLRSLGIKERIFGPDHPLVADDVSSLALVDYRRRDYSKALTMYSRALSIREKTFGRSHPSIALVLNNIGLVHWRLGDYRRAEESYQGALDLAEELFGPDSLRVTNALANLGIVAKEAGDYTLAESRYRRALSIKEKHLGREHPDLITLVESLGILYRDRGDYTRAAEMFQRTLHITETSLGPEHPFVARHLDNIVRLEWATGRWAEASAALERLLAIEERDLALNLSIGSERQKLAYFEPRLQNLEETISFHAAHPFENPRMRSLALTTLLQRKGRVLDALADSLSAFRRRSTSEDQAVLDRLVRVTSELAAVTLSTSTNAQAAQRQRSVTALTAEREKLAIEIHGRSAGYLEPAQPVSLEAVQQAIPADAALLEFALYRPFDPRAAFESGKQFGAPRYVAYVVRQTGELGWKDLGPAESIDAVVEQFRSALADPKAHTVVGLARQLHQHLFTPLQPLLGNAEHLLISPDGALNLIPFEALRSVDGRYLVQDHAISYITTGRDLVRMQVPRPAARGTVVFADPAYGEPTAEPPSRTSGGARGRSVTIGQDLPAVYFAPLAGTATEASRIQTLFPAADVRLGHEATERALKELEPPRVLHIATHGFFLEGADIPDRKGAAEGTRAPSGSTQIENPLLRSGLALAGANRARKGGEDGILTALEAANLNLWGTRLVTLSACDTGLGVVRNGEGVYGLRRAFFLAGAESLVMSLWPVSDFISREMMTGYYGGLEEGLGRGAALRRMQLRMMKRKGRAHPFYWASFIQAGEWATLEGRR